VDGARIFNAATALNTTASDLVAVADSVSFCLSKGLAAPVGSLVCGSKIFIAKARRVRKVLGGGMRQAGVLAAAGIVALTEMVERLSEDHENAKVLCMGLSEIKGLRVDPERVFTNIVYIDITRSGLTESELAGRLETEGVRLIPVGPKRLRAVTHYHITREDVNETLKIVSKVMR
jgi:threonine aldolase